MDNIQGPDFSSIFSNKDLAINRPTTLIARHIVGMATYFGVSPNTAALADAMVIRRYAATNPLPLGDEATRRVREAAVWVDSRTNGSTLEKARAFATAAEAIAGYLLESPNAAVAGNMVTHQVVECASAMVFLAQDIGEPVQAH